MERDDSRLDPNVERWLDDLRGDFACELANHSIGSEHAVYESSPDAMRAMLRQAYRHGFWDATKTPADFDQAVAAVVAVNEAAKRR